MEKLNVIYWKYKYVKKSRENIKKRGNFKIERKTSFKDQQ